MTNVLDTLKQNLKALKISSDSFSDVAPQIEQMVINKSRPNTAVSEPKKSGENKIKPAQNQNKKQNNKSGSVNKDNGKKKHQADTSTRSSSNSISRSGKLKKPSISSTKHSGIIDSSRLLR